MAHHDPVGRIAPPQDLTPASGRQDHTTSPSATRPRQKLRRPSGQSRRSFGEGGKSAVRPRARASLTNPKRSRPATTIARPTLPRPPHPVPNVRDDRDTPLCAGRDGGGYKSDLGRERTGIFLRKGLDRGRVEKPVWQISGMGSQRERACFRAKAASVEGPRSVIRPLTTSRTRAARRARKRNHWARTSTAHRP